VRNRLDARRQRNRRRLDLIEVDKISDGLDQMIETSEPDDAYSCFGQVGS
jgi:hypothetical protein